MAEVCLVPITAENYGECINLRVDDSQSGFVATNAKSLAEASTKPSLFPLAIYDRAALGFEKPAVPMIGFTMYELEVAVGFILRLMIDEKYQRKGYGRAAMIEVIRRLKLHPEVEIIATSHLKENEAATRLYESLGFVDWGSAKKSSDERYLILKENHA